jgi:hypothetical protein
MFDEEGHTRAPTGAGSPDLREACVAICSVTPFKQLDMGRFKASLTEFVDTIASLKHISENLSDVDALAIMAADGPRKVLQMLHSHSNAVKRYLEILLKLRHPGMRERHWMQFFALFEVRIGSRTLSLTEARRPKTGVERCRTITPRVLRQLSITWQGFVGY